MDEPVDHPDLYRSYVKTLKDLHSERVQQPSSHPRFVKFEDRLEKSDLTEEVMKQHMNGRDLTQWCGIVTLKSPLDRCIYQLMMQEIKPATIIEIGTFNGGGTLWMADLMKIHQMKTHVFSLDIDFSYVEPSIRERKDITLITGDVNNIEEAFPDDMLKSLPHPWLIIEDVHINLPGVLAHFDKFTQPGDYIIVEDTHPLIPTRHGYGLFKDIPYAPTGTTWTYEPFKEFMKAHGDKYRVDSAYTDLYGYNATWNYNSILRRV